MKENLLVLTTLGCVALTGYALGIAIADEKACKEINKLKAQIFTINKYNAKLHESHIHIIDSICKRVYNLEKTLSENTAYSEGGDKNAQERTEKNS